MFYYSFLLIRCVLVSLAVSAVVFALRKTILKHNVFMKGALWALFIPVLFAGKMRFFDESRVGVSLSWWWKGLTVNHVWICWMYVCVMLVYAAFLLCKKRKLKKLVAGMKKSPVENQI